jgi:hypothetical protein
MDNKNILHSLITGNSLYAPNDFSLAVSARFLLIKNSEAFSERSSGFCYDGNRTEAENLGWRTSQSVGFELTPEQIAAGEYDSQIAEGFHEAASSEYYYRYEKDWG